MQAEIKVQMLWEEALCRIQHGIEVGAYQALKSLGLECKSDGIDAAMRRMRDEAPLYVHAVAVHGKTMRDHYDENPGFAYYDVKDIKVIRLPQYCGMARAKAIATRHWLAAVKKSECHDDYDGKFNPEFMVLEDRFGNPLQEYSERLALAGGRMGWLDQFPDASEWPGLLSKAREWEEEAAEQSRWDNFESARRARARADALKRQVALAQVQSRVIG